MLELQSTSTRLARFRQWALALCVIVAMPAVAQETMTPDPSATPADSATTRTNLLDGFGKLFKSPAELLSSSSKPEAAPKSDALQPAQAAPAATTAVAPVAVEPPPAAASNVLPGMARGREICPRTVNGAPDCQAGADKLCQSKGYKGGKGLNTDSAFSCSARQARAEGRKPCGTEHFVTSAFCQ